MGSRVNRRTAILLLAFGGPASLSEVEPFLKNVCSGRPLPEPLTSQVRDRYQAIGGASPLLDITRRQARSLQAYLSQFGSDVEVSVGMKHWHPFIPDTLELLEHQGIRNLIYLILSPFSSPAVTGCYDQIVQDYLCRSHSALKAIPVRDWHRTPQYLSALTENVAKGLKAVASSRRSLVSVIFTAHSLPLRVVTQDPYEEQIRATVAAVSKRLDLADYHLAFQSRGRGGEDWLGPAVEQTLEQAAQSGREDILIVPAGFIADHLETLYDLDIVLKEKAERMGLRFYRSPALNDSPLLIRALGDAILGVLAKVKS